MDSLERREFPPQFIDKLLHRDRISMVTQVDNKVGHVEIEEFKHWYRDKRSAEHFSPPFRTAQEVEDYYLGGDNKSFLVARNYYGDPIAVLTVIDGNPFLKDSDGRIAYIEKMLVKPSHQGKGVGRTFLSSVHQNIFQLEEEGIRRFNEIQLYIMTDDNYGEWWKNYNFFINTMGYQIHEMHPQWARYARENWDLPNESEALLLHFTRELWESKEQKLQEQ